MDKFISLNIEQGKEIKTEIGKFLKKLKIEKAIIVGAIGSVKDVCFTVPINEDLPPVIERLNFEGPGEILSFTGEVMERSEMDKNLTSVYQSDEFDFFIHIHASIGINGAQVFGGGFSFGKAFRGLNVFFIVEEESKPNEFT